MRSSIVILSLIALVASRPIRRQAACPSITEQDYADFQISDGTAGNAETAAKAVFVDPSDGCDLSTVDEASLEALKTMREVRSPFLLLLVGSSPLTLHRLQRMPRSKTSIPQSRLQRAPRQTRFKLERCVRAHLPVPHQEA